MKPEALTGFLEANGYGRTGTVMEPGEYAMRGGIIDLFPAGGRSRSGSTCSATKSRACAASTPAPSAAARTLAELLLRPVGEVFLDAESISRFRAAYREVFGAAAADDPLYVSISAGRRHPGMEHWAGLFHASMETLLDYLPGASVSLDHQAEEVLAARLEMIADHYQARRAPVRTHEGEVPYRPAPPGTLYLTRPGWDHMLADGPLFRLSPFARVEEAAGIDAGGRPGRLFTEARAAGQNVFAELRRTRRGDGPAGPPPGGRRLDPGLARAAGQPAAGEPGRRRAGRGSGPDRRN